MTAPDFESVVTEGTGTPVLLLHSTGGDEHQLVDLGSGLAPGAPLLSPRGKVLENGMPRFFRRLAEGVFDVDDLVARTAELAGWVDSVAAAPPIAFGYSNGANIAAALLLLSPHTLSAALLVRPMVPFPASRLAAPPDLRGRRVLLLSGRADPSVPPGQPEELAAMLRGFGADADLNWQNAGHELGAADLRDAQAWFERVRTGTR